MLLDKPTTSVVGHFQQQLILKSATWQVKINTAEWANSAAAEDPLPIDSPPFQE
jgi:hypothetical protein